MQLETWTGLLIAVHIILASPYDTDDSDLPHILRSDARQNRFRSKPWLLHSKAVFVGKGTQKRFNHPDWIKHESDPWFTGLLHNRLFRRMIGGKVRDHCLSIRPNDIEFQSIC